MGATKEILEKQLQLLSERSHHIVHGTDGGSDLVALTDAMIKLAAILEPEIQSEKPSGDLLTYLQNQQFWNQVREHWRSTERADSMR